MKRRDFTYYVGDFETTSYEGQSYTEVWASAIVELHTEDVVILHSISDTYDYLLSLNKDMIIYYHNLKFDGEFWLSFLLRRRMDQAITSDNCFIKTSEMKNNTFKYMISDTGMFYSITIKANNRIIELRDSYKLLPFGVRKIGKSFKTKRQKLDIEYTGFRYAGCTITDQEKEYIKNDVLVIKEALEICFRQGHNKLTIGSCCLAEYKSITGYTLMQDWFPNVSDMAIDPEIYGSDNVDKYVRNSYKGGWCYLAEGKENKRFYNGITVDVNSLYPSMMSSESGNAYPVGKPIFWKGNYIPLAAQCGYYFVRIKTRFKLREGYLPCIQIKNNICFVGTDYLKTSDTWDQKNKRYIREWYDKNGEYHDGKQILTLTMTDFKLINEHYELYETEVLDGCYFQKRVGIFDKYIEKYKQQKLTTEGALREIAKLFLNNLYGKMATNSESSFKVAYLENEVVKYKVIKEFNKDTLYIPVGSAITSYARNFTIRAAQMNYYGKDKKGFIYADTDSLHLDIPESELKGIKLHDKDFNCWKVENNWNVGFFARQKTYIEIGKEITIKCAGMPEKGKKMFQYSMLGTLPPPDVIKNYTEDDIKWIKKKREIEDFTVGLMIPNAKLTPHRIVGGVVLENTTYEMREK